MKPEAATRAHECGCDAMDLNPEETIYRCGGEFFCPGCERKVGWCRGAHDELEDLCDDCACEVFAARERFAAEDAVGQPS